MARKWQIVLLGVVVLGGLELSGMHLRCSQDVKKEQFILAKALNNSGKKEEEKNNVSNLYYSFPGASSSVEPFDQVIHSNGVHGNGSKYSSASFCAHYHSRW